jgi:hypothetical protein
VQPEVPPVGEADARPDPLLIEEPGAVAQPVERLRAVDHQAAGHAEPDAEGRAVIGVEQQELAPASSLGERMSDQGGSEAPGRGAAPPVARVNHPAPGYVAIEALFR